MCDKIIISDILEMSFKNSVESKFFLIMQANRYWDNLLMILIIDLLNLFFFLLSLNLN